MAILKRICIALIVGGLLVAVAAIVALVVGTSTRFFQGCAVIAVGCVFVFFVLAGRGPFGYDYPYRRQLTLSPEFLLTEASDSPVDTGTSGRLRPGYVLVAALPAIVIALLHYVA